eukprot:gene18128-19938_t
MSKLPSQDSGVELQELQSKNAGNFETDLKCLANEAKHIIEDIVSSCEQNYLEIQLKNSEKESNEETTVAELKLRIEKLKEGKKQWEVETMREFEDLKTRLENAEKSKTRQVKLKKKVVRRMKSNKEKSGLQLIRDLKDKCKHERKNKLVCVEELKKYKAKQSALQEEIEDWTIKYGRASNRQSMLELQLLEEEASNSSLRIKIKEQQAIIELMQDEIDLFTCRSGVNASGEANAGAKTDRTVQGSDKQRAKKSSFFGLLCIGNRRTLA